MSSCCSQALSTGAWYIGAAEKFTDESATGTAIATEKSYDGGGSLSAYAVAVATGMTLSIGAAAKGGGEVYWEVNAWVGGALYMLLVLSMPLVSAL